jgi:hypothetical protein
VEKYLDNPYLGQFLTPRTGNSVERMQKTNLPWACDNGAFKGFDEAAYFRMLERVSGKDKLIFVTMPDVVGDHIKTKELFDQYYEKVSAYNVPLAYVLQNGVTVEEIPWDKISAIFIGGDTLFKLSKEARHIVAIAKDKDKWVHMGRVNSERRIRYAQNIGCDSIDGSGFSMFPGQKIPWGLEILSQEQFCIRECLL